MFPRLSSVEGKLAQGEMPRGTWQALCSQNSLRSIMCRLLVPTCALIYIDNRYVWFKVKTYNFTYEMYF